MNPIITCTTAGQPTRVCDEACYLQGQPSNPCICRGQNSEIGLANALRNNYHTQQTLIAWWLAEDLGPSHSMLKIALPYGAELVIIKACTPPTENSASSASAQPETSPT